MQAKINICNLYLLDEKNKKVLLIYKSSGSQKYYAPGGKIDQNESYGDAAIREFYEETNLVIEKVDFVCKNIHFTPDKITTINSFVAYEYSGQLIVNHREGELEWISYTDIDKIVMTSGDRLVLKDLINKNSKSEYEFHYE